MALTFVKLTESEVKEEFKRSAASDDNIQPIIAQFTDAGISVGDGFKLKVEDETVDGMTVRATKRRYNAAADSLGFNLKWKLQGHVEKAIVEEDGKEKEQDVFFTDWLVVRVDSNKPKVLQEGEKKRGRPAKNGQAAA